MLRKAHLNASKTIIFAESSLDRKKSRWNLQAPSMLHFQSLKSLHAIARLGQPRRANDRTPTDFFTDRPDVMCSGGCVILYILSEHVVAH